MGTWEGLWASLALASHRSLKTEALQTLSSSPVVEMEGTRGGNVGNYERHRLGLCSLDCPSPASSSSPHKLWDFDS